MPLSWSVGELSSWRSVRTHAPDILAPAHAAPLSSSARTPGSIHQHDWRDLASVGNGHPTHETREGQDTRLYLQGIFDFVNSVPAGREKCKPAVSHPVRLPSRPPTSPPTHTHEIPPHSNSRRGAGLISGVELYLWKRSSWGGTNCRELAAGFCGRAVETWFELQ